MYFNFTHVRTRKSRLETAASPNTGLDQCWHNITSRDGRISDPGIQIQPDFHYLAKSASGQIACFTLDRISVN